MFTYLIKNVLIAFDIKSFNLNVCVMRRIAAYFILFQFMTTSVWSQVSFGQAEKINNNWKFELGDMENAHLPEFDDSKWRPLELPHDWSVEGTYSPDLASATGYLPGGMAWYRKTIDIPANMNGKKVYIYFEGVYRNSEVFINGKMLGLRPNGYISFMYELSPELKFGEPNSLAVRVDHSKSNDSRWYTGSGIYRDVYLIYANPVHIEQWGVYCTSPKVTAEQATVHIETSVLNESTEKTMLLVVNELYDQNNKLVAKASEKLMLVQRGSETIKQDINVKQPNLWSVERPYLYKLVTSVYQGKELLDRNNMQVGIRSLKFDHDKGFALNNVPTKVKGVCLHHDAGCLGAAVPVEVLKRRLVGLKSMGCNAIRTSHNPQSPALYDLCDELGFLVFDEAFDEWEFAKKKWVKGWNVGVPEFQGAYEFFADWGKTDLKDMVLRDRNHPSVFMWSIGNEVDYPNDPYSHPILNSEGIEQQHTAGYLPDHPNAERLGDIALQLAAVVREFDTSRPVSAGLAGPVMSNETDYPSALDVVGYNYTERRYEQDHTTYPKRVLFGSENGHSMDAWKAVRDKEYIFGQFLWTGIDYLGEAHRWPSRGFTSGLLDLAGFKKPRAYFRESLWSDQPMVYIGTYKNRRQNNWLSIDALPLWNYREDDTVRVVCYTNCQNVQLLLNGQALGELKPYNDESGIIHWDIPYQPGKLEVIGFNAGNESARYAIETSKRPAAIVAKVYGEPKLLPEGIAQIEIQIVDEDGKPVLLSDDELNFRVRGAAKLLGLEASDSRDMGDYSDNRQRVFQGKMLAYIKADKQSGKALVSITSPWLKGAEIELEVE